MRTRTKNLLRYYFAITLFFALFAFALWYGDGWRQQANLGYAAFMTWLGMQIGWIAGSSADAPSREDAT